MDENHNKYLLLLTMNITELHTISMHRLINKYMNMMSNAGELNKRVNQT